MLIGVHREGRREVTQRFRRDLRVNAAGQQHGCVGVSKIVQSDLQPQALRQPVETLRQPVGVGGGAVPMFDDQIVILPVRPQAKTTR